MPSNVQIMKSKPYGFTHLDAQRLLVNSKDTAFRKHQGLIQEHDTKAFRF